MAAHESIKVHAITVISYIDCRAKRKLWKEGSKNSNVLPQIESPEGNNEWCSRTNGGSTGVHCFIKTISMDFAPK